MSKRVNLKSDHHEKAEAKMVPRVLGAGGAYAFRARVMPTTQERVQLMPCGQTAGPELWA